MTAIAWILASVLLVVWFLGALLTLKAIGCITQESTEYDDLWLAILIWPIGALIILTMKHKDGDGNWLE